MLICRVWNWICWARSTVYVWGFGEELGQLSCRVGQTCLCATTRPTVCSELLRDTSRRLEVCFLPRGGLKELSARTTWREIKSGQLASSGQPQGLFGLCRVDSHANLASSEDRSQLVSTGKQLMGAKYSCLGGGGWIVLLATISLLPVTSLLLLNSL